MTSSRKVPAVIVALAVLFVARLSPADDATELERARTSYDAGRYAEGVERFKEILNPDSPNVLHDPVAVERARAYYAACLIALGRTDEAYGEIEKIYRQNPTYTPDAVVFPGKVVDRFMDVKARFKGEVERAEHTRADAERVQHEKQRAYIDTLQKLASQESVVVRHSRWVAALPFGVGQFQNGQDGLGYALLVTEALLAGVSITAGVIHTQLVADYPNYEPGQVVYDDFVSRKNTARDVSVYSTAALAVIAIGGVVHAQLTFVPEVRESRPRPIPKPPQLTPTVGMAPSGFVLGFSGKF